ncbi:hypothetical protein [Streptomyces sp. NPDC001985]|uniref:hypothetical protein n=1 Tax=Streptomyces sp. NPDC001985 TaxID=3154406 RepID=UPI00331CDA87
MGLTARPGLIHADVTSCFSRPLAVPAVTRPAQALRWHYELGPRRTRTTRMRFVQRR